MKRRDGLVNTITGHLEELNNIILGGDVYPALLLRSELSLLCALAE